MASVDSREKAERGRLLAVEDREMAPHARCTWCGEFGDKHHTMYAIMKKYEIKGDDIRLPKGFICGRCACSAEQALILWGEDGTLF